MAMDRGVSHRVRVGTPHSRFRYASQPRERGMPTRTLRLTPLTLWMGLIFIVSASYYKRHRKLLYRSYCI